MLLHVFLSNKYTVSKYYIITLALYYEERDE